MMFWRQKRDFQVYRHLALLDLKYPYIIPPLHTFFFEILRGQVLEDGEGSRVQRNPI